MSNEIANITIIRETLRKLTVNEISKHTGLNLGTYKTKKWRTFNRKTKFT